MQRPSAPVIVDNKTKSPLHEIFIMAERQIDVTRLRNNEMTYAVLAVKSVIEKAHYDVNERDELGNTLFHRSAWMHLDNRCSPRTAMDIFKSWHGLLLLGADPLIKNNAGMTPIDLYFRMLPKIDNRPAPYFIPLFGVLIDFPHHINLIFSALDYCKEDVNNNTNNNHFQSMNVKGLPLGILEPLLKWINTHIQPQFDKSSINIRAQIAYINTYKYLDDTIAKIVLADPVTAHAIFRFMLIADISQYPLFSLLQSVIDRVSTDNLPMDNVLHEKLIEFVNRYTRLVEQLAMLKIKTYEPLTKKEELLGTTLFENLKNALDGNIYADAKRDFEKREQSTAFRDLKNRHDTYLPADKPMRKLVFTELVANSATIQTGEYFKSRGFFNRRMSGEKVVRMGVGEGQTFSL